MLKIFTKTYLLIVLLAFLITAWRSQRSKEGIGFPGTGVKAGCELPWRGRELKSRRSPSGGAVSPVPVPFRIVGPVCVRSCHGGAARPGWLPLLS